MLQTGPGSLSIRNNRILVGSFEEKDVGQTAEIRAYSTNGTRSTVLLSQNSGEEPEYFGQVAQDDHFAYSVRYGYHNADTLIRIPLRGGAVQTARASTRLTGAFAMPTATSAIYTDQPTDAADSTGAKNARCDGSVLVPCRVVLSTTPPFSDLQRSLAPELTVKYEGVARRGQPLTFIGRLTRTVVGRRGVVRVDPLSGVSVELYRGSGKKVEQFAPTGLRGVTDASGTYRIVLPAATADPWYTAVAATPGLATWAGEGTMGALSPNRR